jgi:hypothetical protein
MTNDTQEYEVLLEKYEALTFEEARVLSRFHQADCLMDDTARGKLSVELFAVSAQRQDAHTALMEHECERKAVKAGSAF